MDLEMVVAHYVIFDREFQSPDYSFQMLPNLEDQLTDICIRRHVRMGGIRFGDRKTAIDDWPDLTAFQQWPDQTVQCIHHGSFRSDRP